MRLNELERKMRRAADLVETLRQVGSHRRYRVTRNGQSIDVTIPQHRGEMKNGTVASIGKTLAPILGEGWWK